MLCLQHVSFLLIVKVRVTGKSLAVSVMRNHFHFTSTVVAVDFSHVSYHPLRGVVSVRLQIVLVGTCRLCGAWSVAGHNHRKVIGQDPICVD